MSTDQLEALAEQIESVLRNAEANFANTQDTKAIRRRLCEGARKLSVALEEPRDTLAKVGYRHFELPLVVVGVETGLLAALVTESRAFTSEELSGKSGIDHYLLSRLLRYYQAVDIIAQVNDNGFKATNITRTLSNSFDTKSIEFSQKITAPASIHLPEWLKSINYKDPSGIKPTAWGSSFKTDQHPYAWMAENPWALDLAIAHMRVQRAGRPVFFDVLDFKERFARDATSETVLFVDIGGSTGPQSLSLRSRFPDLPGRVIVQDRPEIVQQAKGKIDSSTNIEIVVHDFMTPQPVTGAKVYYLRNILHAWDDETCVKILQNIKVAMTEESTILLDENVVPERDAPARVAEHDIEMMLCLGTKERTKAMWQALVEKAGLKMHEVIIYDEDDQDGVIVVMLK